MGGHCLRIPFIKDPRTGFCLSYIITMGKYLNTELVKREVRVGKLWVDFGNDICRGIEIDGQEYHGDIIKQQERDDYFNDFGWQVLHIKAIDLWQQPEKTKHKVIAFLTQ